MQMFGYFCAICHNRPKLIIKLNINYPMQTSVCPLMYFVSE